MKLYFLLFVSLICLSNSIEESNYKNKKLTFIESFDKDNTFYIINSIEEYKDIQNLKKNETIKNSSSYSYEWSNHPKNKLISLNSFLPEADSDGYRNMSRYDTIYLNIYSKRIIDTKIALILGCQKREPDEISDMTYSYKGYLLPINFAGWKEFKIPFKTMDNSYGADLSKVSRFEIYSYGWGQTSRKETELYIDEISFTKLNYKFNMEESEIAEENYINALNRLKYSFIGTGSLLKEKNSNILKMFKANIKTAIDTHKLMNKEGVPFNNEIDSSLDIYLNYYKMQQIAIGYSIEGSDIYKNKEIFDDIVRGLDYMHENYYTKRYPRKFKGSNDWFHWDIGIPRLILEIISYLKEELAQEQIDKYLTPINKYIFYPKYTAANRAMIGYVSIISGIFQKDYKRIAISIEMLREIFQNAEVGDGFYDDGSFIQHNVYAFAGLYGEALFNSLSKISYILDDSCFRLDDEMKEKQYNWIINSFIPLLYNGAFFDLVRGGDVINNILGVATGYSIINSFSFVSQYIKNPQNLKHLKIYLKYIYEKNEKYYNTQLSIAALSFLDEIISDELIKSENIIKNFSKVYSRMDKAVSQINGIGFGISLSSTRIGKYESINGQNTRGWYQGDGMTYIYLSQNDYAKLYWPYVNLIRLPGTTVTNAPREPKGLTEYDAYAKYDFVGGTYSDANMVVAMKFASESPGVEFFSSLSGNKAYFIFENNLIFIGNNISCNDSYNVETIIENRKLNGKFYFGNEEITNKYGSISSNFIYIENYGGIYISDYKNVKYNLTNNGFLEIYFDHGNNITNGTYKYYIFPNIDKDNLEKYFNNFEILCDTVNITVVKNKLNNIIEYIFWEKGAFDKMEVDNPCTIILYENEFYISDPSQKIDIINVNYNNVNYKVKLEKGYTFKVKIINENSNKSKIISIKYIILLIYIVLFI